MVRFASLAAYLAAATALAVVYYFGFGAGPTASEYLDDLEWWRPWGTAVRWLPLVPLTEMARGGLPRALVPFALFCAPPLALFAGGLALFRKSALARAYLFFLALTMCLFVYYGYRAEQVWRFFEWRFAAVATAFTGIVSIILFSPSLLRGLARASRVLALVAIGLAFAGVFVLSTEVTGTNSDMPFNISPWPIVTLVGFLLVGATIAASHASGGAAVWLHRRVGGLAGAALGVALALAVGLVAGWLIFTAPAGWFTVALIASVYALVCMLLAQRDPVEARRSGFYRFAAGALLLLAIFGSYRIASLSQRTARDETALDVLVALEAYKKDRETYPETLDELVPDYVAEVPRPAIGLIRDEDDRFAYSNYGDSYALEFASVLWVQCQYSPPYSFASADPEELAEEEAEESADGDGELESWETPDVSAPRPPTADELALAARLHERGLEGSWTCPEEPPKLW
jgi:hypothetical protein